LPSPTKDSPTRKLLIFAMLNVPFEEKNEKIESTIDTLNVPLFVFLTNFF
jgi:hypothetical protein